MISLIAMTKKFYYFDVSGTIVTVSRITYNTLFSAQQRAIAKFRRLGNV